jgi:outer membrane protein OmpA-like peptidoglycan-associated protein
MRVRGLILALICTTATAAGAQTAGTIEITGFGRYSRFDDVLAIQEGPSGGGSLGFYPIRNLAVEAEAAYSQSHSNLTGIGITNIPLRSRLTYHIPLGGYASALRIGAGYLRNLYRKDVNFDDNGFTGVVGFRWGLSPSFGFRVDGTADYVRSPEADRADQYVNWGAQVGLSLLMGGSHHGKQPKDSDKDGVGNEVDRCPATPVGKTVDGNGCSSDQRDGDHDGVNDETDRCEGTGFGENVDTDGCAASQKDDDNDGVTNPVDQCAGTEQGHSVNGSGCSAGQRDEDADGVSDAIDQCPNTPAGDAVNARGCFLERDSDGDNVPDKRDRCPNTRAGVSADANGCPIVVPAAADERDTDGDSVPDKRDRCPDTPKGEPADANGCTILFNKGKRSVILRGVTFLPSRATLTPQAREILRDVASQLVENPQYRVQVSGHTDIRGTRAKNLRLSLARARTVETFLEANGVPPTQVTAKGFGPDVPIASNKTAAGRARNRRVELNRTN